MIHLVDIDERNWRTPLHVSKEQAHFVASPSTILARAYAFRNQRSRAFLIYCDETPVGMVLYHDSEDWGGYIFSELLIDEKHQRKGFGRKATQLVLDALRKDGNYLKVCLCYVEGNEAAKKLYESFGFVETNRDGNEIIMELEL